MSNRTLHVILVPGLDDGRYNALRLLARRWSRKRVKLHPCPVGWRDGGPFGAKLDHLLSCIDRYGSDGDPVALVGTSAGGSMVINAFAQRLGVIAAVNVCGRLRAGENVHPSLEDAARSSGAFKQSVIVCESTQREISMEQRARILVLKPWRDEVVPLDGIGRSD